MDDMDGIVFQTLDDRRRNLERDRENASRLAEVGARFHTTGIGTQEFETRVDFGVTFIREPLVSYGAEIDVDDLERTLDAHAHPAAVHDAAFPNGDNGPPAFPITSGFVTNWDTDSRGFYVGAWCGVRVWYPPVFAIDPATSALQILQVIAPIFIRHHFRFSAVGMKDIPTGLTE